MESLKVIDERYADLMEAIEASVNPETGEPDEELVACLEDLEMKRDEKFQNHIRLRVIKKARANAIKAEIQRLQKMLKAEEHFLQWQEDYLDGILGEGERFECADGTISRRTSQAVKIVDEEKLPIQYIVLKKQVDKAQMLKDLKEGKHIDGAELETRRKVQVR